MNRSRLAAATLTFGILAGCAVLPSTPVSSTPPSSPPSGTEPSPSPNAPSEPPGASAPVSPDLPGHGRIAFNVEWGPDGDNYKNIYSIEPDGTGLLVLTHLTAAIAGEPAWTPDGARILYSFEDSTKSGAHIFSMDSAGGSVEQLTVGPHWTGRPAVSPDGSLVAFCIGGDVVARIYMMRTDGSGLAAITTPPTTVVDGDVDPAFSPDGTQLAFLRDGAIEVIRLDGTGLRQVTSPADDVRHPSWSPDGTRILFSSSEGVQVVNADGTGLRRIENGGDPAWSPDGTRIAYHRYTDGTHYIALVVANADGSNAVEIWHTQPNTDTFIVGAAWGTAP